MSFFFPRDRLGKCFGGKYRVDSLLGQGGMGVVYAGTHLSIDREIAIKVMLPRHAEERGAIRRFVNEARSAAKLRNRHVVEILDVGSEEGEAYLVMERLHGESLASRLSRGTLSLERSVSILVPIMRALAEAHEKGVVHRDIKPENIFLANDGSVDFPKLLDFGVAKLREGGEAPSTTTGTTLGTVWYMSPEQARGSKELGPAADVWSIAMVFYVCLVGKMPFDVTNPLGAVLAICDDGHRLVPLEQVCPGLPRDVYQVIDRALHRDASERPSVSELADSLQNAVMRGSDLPATPPSVVAPQLLRPSSPRPKAERRTIPPFEAPMLEELRELFAQAYHSPAYIKLHLDDAGIDCRRINFGLPIDQIWEQALKSAESQWKLGLLCEHTLADPNARSHHVRLRAWLRSWLVAELEKIEPADLATGLSSLLEVSHRGSDLEVIACELIPDRGTERVLRPGLWEWLNELRDRAPERLSPTPESVASMVRLSVEEERLPTRHSSPLLARVHLDRRAQWGEIMDCCAGSDQRARHLFFFLHGDLRQSADYFLMRLRTTLPEKTQAPYSFYSIPYWLDDVAPTDARHWKRRVGVALSEGESGKSPRQLLAQRSEGVHLTLLFGPYDELSEDATGALHRFLTETLADWLEDIRPTCGVRVVLAHQHDEDLALIRSIEEDWPESLRSAHLSPIPIEPFELPRWQDVLIYLRKIDHQGETTRLGRLRERFESWRRKPGASFELLAGLVDRHLEHSR